VATTRHLKLRFLRLSSESFFSMTIQGGAAKKRNLHSTLTVGGSVSFLNLSYNEVQRKAKPVMLCKCLVCCAVCAR